MFTTSFLTFLIKLNVDRRHSMCVRIWEKFLPVFQTGSEAQMERSRRTGETWLILFSISGNNPVNLLQTWFFFFPSSQNIIITYLQPSTGLVLVLMKLPVVQPQIFSSSLIPSFPPSLTLIRHILVAANCLKWEAKILLMMWFGRENFPLLKLQNWGSTTKWKLCSLHMPRITNIPGLEVF